MQVKRRPLVYLGILLLVVVSAYLFYNNFIVTKPSEEGVYKGNLLLDEIIPSVDGVGSVSFSSFRNKVLVIDFMAPWCEPCKFQIPILKEVESIDGVEVVSINIDPKYDMGYLNEFKAEEEIEWFFGHSPSTALKFEINAIPTILVVDRNGIIVYRDYFTTIIDFERILTDLIT